MGSGLRPPPNPIRQISASGPISPSSQVSPISCPVKAGRPVVFDKVPELAQACQQWDFEHFIRHGAESVDIEHYPSAARCDAFERVQMPVAEYIRRARQEPDFLTKYYLAELRLENAFQDPAASLQIVPTPEIAHGQPKLKPVIFLGIDTFTTAHYHRHSSQALLCQIEGKKVVRTFPPAALTHLSLWPWYAQRSNHSRIRFGDLDTDVDLLPDAARNLMQEFTLEPGQALFIPDHWLHLVYGIGENISITYFWPSKFRHAHTGGLIRDVASSCVRGLLTNSAKPIATMLGPKRAAALGVRLGLISESDREAVTRTITDEDLGPPKS